MSTWLEDPRVRKISFTGSTRVGQVLLRQAADRVVNSSMELGGNAPFVVTDDADLDAAVQGALVAKFRNGGQACTAANRFYVHEAVAADFTARLGAAVEALSVGPATDPDAQVGPVISPAAATRIEQAIADAVAAGARVAHRAEVPEGLTGYFVAPTVLADVPADADIVQEEIFGPVAPDRHFRHGRGGSCASPTPLSTAWRRTSSPATSSARSGWPRRSTPAWSASTEVSSPTPRRPSAGLKQSGLGREGAREGLLEYTEQQYLSVDWADQS